MSEMSFGFTFEMPSFIKADYSYVEDAIFYLKSNDYDDYEEFSEGDGGWVYEGKILTQLVNDQPQFDEIEEDEDGYKTFARGLVTSLQEAYEAVIEPFEDPEVIKEIDHRINGSTEAFESALAQNS